MEEGSLSFFFIALDVNFFTLQIENAELFNNIKKNKL